MDNLMGKIQEVLSDEESMNQLNELAKMFSSSENQESRETVENQESDNIETDGIGDFDFSKLFMLQDMMSRASGDKTTELLLALKPLLKAERQERVDKAVKILKLLTVWTILKDSGMLNELF